MVIKNKNVLLLGLLSLFLIQPVCLMAAEVEPSAMTTESQNCTDPSYPTDCYYQGSVAGCCPSDTICCFDGNWLGLVSVHQTHHAGILISLVTQTLLPSLGYDVYCTGRRITTTTQGGGGTGTYLAAINITGSGARMRRSPQERCPAPVLRK